MFANKRKGDDEPAITVYKRVRGARSPKPPLKAQSAQEGTSRLLQENHFVVTSVESSHRNRRVGFERVGFEHYLWLQGKQPEHEPVRENVSIDRYNHVESEEATCADIDEQALIEPARDRSPSPNIKSEMPPTPRHPYFQPMFAATTQNPAVFLAITRVAQRNLFFLNFDSALNHLPNFPAAATLPNLIHGAFVDDTKYEKRKDDHEMQVLFLPQYYDDGRHALGYYALSSNGRGKCVSTCLFTPCTDMELEYHSLIEFFNDYRVGYGIAEETEWTTRIKAVGARNGRWLEFDVVEDWDEWTLGLQIVGDIWKTRFGLTTGAGEGGGERWKP